MLTARTTIQPTVDYLKLKFSPPGSKFHSNSHHHHHHHHLHTSNLPMQTCNFYSLPLIKRPFFILFSLPNTHKHMRPHIFCTLKLDYGKLVYNTFGHQTYNKKLKNQ